MVVHSFSSHRECDQVPHHPSVHLQPVLSRKPCYDALHCRKRNKCHLFIITLLDLLLNVLSASANQLHEFFIFRRVPKQRNRLFFNRKAFLFVRGLLGDDLIGRGWSSAHEQIRRVAASEDLGKLLEVDLSIFSDIDKGEYILELLVFGKLLARLGVEFLHHAVEFFEVEVATSWVVPLPKGILGRYHVIMQQVANMLQPRL